MYKQFVKNMDWFLELNTNNDYSANYRFDLVKELEAIKSIEEFNELKYKDLNRYYKLSTIIWAINENIYRYPSFKVLSWEL